MSVHDPNSAVARLGLTRTMGRGVYAGRDIRAGETIERAPVLVIPAAQWADVAKSLLFDYTFEWGTTGEDAALAMGYGSFYNHSYASNARYIKDLDNLVIEFVALRDIAVGEEILVNYNGDPADSSPLWFPAE